MKKTKKRTRKTKRTAMIDMASGFGQGSSLLWTVEALQDGEKFLKERLKKATKSYWDPGIREDAIALARTVGEKASYYATHPTAPNPIITPEALAKAIKDVVPVRGDCPFGR